MPLSTTSRRVTSVAWAGSGSATSAAAAAAKRAIFMTTPLLQRGKGPIAGLTKLSAGRGGAPPGGCAALGLAPALVFPSAHLRPRPQHIVDAVGVRRLAVAHLLHLLQDARHLLVGQDRRIAEGE